MSAGAVSGRGRRNGRDFDAAAVRRAETMARDGYTAGQIAARLGCDRGRLADLLKGRGWRATRRGVWTQTTQVEGEA